MWQNIKLILLLISVLGIGIFEVITAIYTKFNIELGFLATISFGILAVASDRYLNALSDNKDKKTIFLAGINYILIALLEFMRALYVASQTWLN